MKKFFTAFALAIYLSMVLCGCGNSAEKYAYSNIELTSAKVDQFMTYLESYEWGISDIAVTNNGNKTIEGFLILITFYDKDGNPVADNEVWVAPDTPLKAGYSWKEPEDYYYEIENVPDTADTTKYDVSVKEVRFSK